MSSILSSLRVSASALTAQRLRMDVLANNIANAETTRTEEGGPYQRQQVVFTPNQPEEPFAAVLAQNGLRQAAFDTGAIALDEGARPGRGVLVQAIVEDERPGERIYNPAHPDADAEGYVTMPNVDVVTEMTDMLSATRSYEANVTVFNAIKGMALKALELGQK